jgi:hypothetical protein
MRVACVRWWWERCSTEVAGCVVVEEFLCCRVHSQVRQGAGGSAGGRWSSGNGGCSTRRPRVAPSFTNVTRCGKATTRRGQRDHANAASEREGGGSQYALLVLDRCLAVLFQLLLQRLKPARRGEFDNGAMNRTEELKRTLCPRRPRSHPLASITKRRRHRQPPATSTTSNERRHAKQSAGTHAVNAHTTHTPTRTHARTHAGTHAHTRTSTSAQDNTKTMRRTGGMPRPAA